MGQTVVAFFKDASDAQKALSRLEEKGISRQHVDVSRGEYKDGTADADGRNTNKITDMFNKLFGHDNDDAKRYSTVGQTNVSIVTVHAPSRELAEEAADVLDDCGAIDVDEHSHSTGHHDDSRTGTNFGTGASTGMGNMNSDMDMDRGTTTGGTMGNMNTGLSGGSGLGTGDMSGMNSDMDMDRGTNTGGTMGNMNTGLGGGSGLNTGDTQGLNSGSSGSTNKWRSRIFDNSLDDNYRLRGE